MASAPMYPSFAAVTLLVLALLILLARASQVAFDDGGDERGRSRGRASEGGENGASSAVPATGAARVERHEDTGQSRMERREREILAGGEDEGEGESADAGEGKDPSEDERGGTEGKTGREDATPWDLEDDAETPWGENLAEEDARHGRGPEDLELTTGTLLANVAVSQGVFGAVLVGAAWLAGIPTDALGVVPADPWSAGAPAVALGAGAGVALYVANELAAVIADAAGVEYAEGVRESLAPDSPAGWAVLLGVVLPVIAGFEELLFRAALIGAFSAGFGVSPWLLAVLSTAAFAVGHGAQGPGGIAVTGLLGFALAGAFVLTGSLLVVVVAHYVVNALEFVVHEGLGVEWT